MLLVVASSVPELVSMSIWMGESEANAVLFAWALVKSTVPKSDSGSTPLSSDGASAMTSDRKTHV